ncbi:hypothetical protein [Winogradskyella sp. A3E31]|uniref:hypothetical protein n=1 Tax=Winogradskyella sp. A3E31 TaxID=3349637 RepID=UPI00398B33FA
MKKTRYLLSLCFFVGFLATAQTDLRGKVVADDDVDGIHVLNKTALKYTITEVNGSFIIPVKMGDTLTVTGIKYITKEVIITESILDREFLEVRLEERVNQLDQVIVGKILTGNLGSDIRNSDAKTDIDFYDLGIPGYTGPRMTQNEQKLYDADNGKIAAIGILYGGVNVHKLLNKISGRTKKLKDIVALDAKNQCMLQFKDLYANALFEKESLAESLQMDYFYFCSDDPNFDKICDDNNPLEQMEFLQKKLLTYKALQTSEVKN